MAYTQKAQGFIDVLAVELAQRLTVAGGLAAALTVVKAYDTDGAPMLSIGTLAAGSASAQIKIGSVATVNKDSLGLGQVVYSPHLFEVVTENASAINAYPLALQAQLVILASLTKLGGRTVWYSVPSAQAPTIANKALAITTGSTNVIENLQYPGVASM